MSFGNGQIEHGPGRRGAFSPELRCTQLLPGVQGVFYEDRFLQPMVAELESAEAAEIGKGMAACMK